MRLIASGESLPPQNEVAVRSEPQFQLCDASADLFPGSTHARLAGLADATDRALWEYAKTNSFVLVTLDSDFAEGRIARAPAEGGLAAMWQSADCRGGRFDPEPSGLD
jgi:hypothetical protein